MSRHLAVVGMQWGDEGKGKIVDYLAQSATAVCRFQGGDNAGHTLVVGGQRIALHLIPSGVLQPDVRCFIGAGVALAPDVLIREIDALRQQGFDLDGRLGVSRHCALVLDIHRRIDAAADRRAGLGTTGRGIGPAYEDRIARRGILLGDMFEPDFRSQLERLYEYHNFRLTGYYGEAAADVEEQYRSCRQVAEHLQQYITDVSEALDSINSAGGAILFEGAQGAMLDVVRGTWPYVTSSHTLPAAISFGAGFDFRRIGCVVGIVKAYATRVGEGPFATEQDGEIGRRLSERGHEIGTTTGRPRRCGWLDAGALKRVAHLGGVDAMVLTKLDVLDGFDEILISRGSDGNGSPQYETLPGWDGKVAGASRWEDLPAGAKRFIEHLEALIEVPLQMISTGPDREHTIVRVNPWGG